MPPAAAFEKKGNVRGHLVLWSGNWHPPALPPEELQQEFPYIQTQKRLRFHEEKPYDVA